MWEKHLGEKELQKSGYDNMYANFLSSSWPIFQLCLNRAVQFSSLAQLCPTLCDSINRSPPGLPVHHQLLEFTQNHVHQVGDATQTSHPLSSLLLLYPIPPCIRVFSSESNLRIRWPKYWSFSFSICPSNELPGLISYRMDWVYLHWGITN